MKNDFELIAVTAGAKKYHKYLTLNDAKAKIGTIENVESRHPA